MAEELARRRIHAIGPGAQIHPVQIDGEDLVLAQPMLQPEGEQQFLHLALERTLRCQEQVLRHLLGNGAAALHDPSGPQVDVGRPRQADDVEPEMIVEAAVLGGDHCLRHGRRQLAQGDGGAVDVAHRSQGRAVGRQQRDHRLARRRQGLGDVRQVIGVPGKHAAECDHPPDRRHRRPLADEQRGTAQPRFRRRGLPGPRLLFAR